MMFVAGISFKTAPVGLREQLAVIPSRLVAAAARLKQDAGLAEIVLVSTCNRVEVYGAADQAINPAHVLGLLSRAATDLSPYLYFHTDADAARHLFAVASGLDSMVLGETEITGQIKSAYDASHAAQLTGRVLNCAFQRAFQVVKAVRTQTQIGRGATSVGSVAVQLAEKILGADFREKTIMIIGAGKMGEACVRHIAKKGIRSVIVANRTLETAAQLAREFGGRAVNYMDDGLTAMCEADIVVSSTGCPETILDRDEVDFVMRTRPGRPLFLIDIAVPRDIASEVGQIENVFLYNIDHLEEIIRENVKVRAQEVAGCRGIIEKHTAELMAKLADSRGISSRNPLVPHLNWICPQTVPLPIPP
ncbi:MAG TPA: glutamyl-tRNA reductase [Verrucomicrobiae bacterium]|nr:glutamyl-tRNA reductase [Verrucomicrobiae bacterium]